MTFLTDPITKPIKKETKKIEKDVQTFEDDVKYDFELLGEYLLFGFITTGLVAIPLLNELSKKIPQAIESAAKIAEIVKPI